jgi:hypothetical protein
MYLARSRTHETALAVPVAHDRHLEFAPDFFVVVGSYRHDDHPNGLARQSAHCCSGAHAPWRAYR